MKGGICRHAKCFQYFTICDAIKQNESEVENVYFLEFSIRVLCKLYFGENPMVTGQLVLEK